MESTNFFLHCIFVYKFLLLIFTLDYIPVFIWSFSVAFPVKQRYFRILTSCIYTGSFANISFLYTALAAFYLNFNILWVFTNNFTNPPNSFNTKHKISCFIIQYKNNRIQLLNLDQAVISKSDPMFLLGDQAIYCVKTVKNKIWIYSIPKYAYNSFLILQKNCVNLSISWILKTKFLFKCLHNV